VIFDWKRVNEDAYARALLKSRVDENIVDSQVDWVLFSIRMRHYVQPWIDLAFSAFRMAKTTWEYAHGRYRRASSQVHGGATQQSGGGTGAPTTFTIAATGARYSNLPAGAGQAAGLSFPNNPPARFFEDAGVVAGEVVARRCWKLGPDGLLYSVYQDHVVWQPNEIMEGDAAGGDGVHAFKDVLSLASYGQNYASHILVSGEVEMWGDVFEHKRGYRASKARIIRIDDSPNYDAAELRKKYGLNRRKKARKP
jgi:hypothetical protein